MVFDNEELEFLDVVVINGIEMLFSVIIDVENFDLLDDIDSFLENVLEK